MLNLKFRKNILFFSGIILIIILFIFAIFAPYIANYNPSDIDIKSILSPPSPTHFLGTDELGRDVFSRLVYASRVSIKVAFLAISISVVIGVLLGSVSGIFGGAVDSFIMRFVDVMLCFPTFFLILAVIAYLEPSIFNVMLIIGATSWMGICRMVRAEILSLKNREFVLSSRISGASISRILFIHILPNVLPVVLVYATLGIGGAILTESSLSFLGLGVQPPNPSWGNMLMSGKDNIEFAWWLSVFPGCSIFVTIIAFNFIGEGLQDILNPKKLNES